MEIISSEEPKVEKFDFGTGATKQSHSIKEIDDFLKDYKQSMTVDPEPSKPSTPIPPLQTHQQPLDPWGNKQEFYVRGPKKGQPKPHSNTTQRPTQQPPTQQPPTQQPQNHTLGGELLTGALFLLLMDMLVPNLIALINNMVSKVKVDGDDLKLSAKQKSELEPIADRVVKHINLDNHPIALYFLCTCAMYSMQLLSARMDVKPSKVDLAKQAYDLF